MDREHEFRFADVRSEGTERVVTGTLAPFNTGAIIGGKFKEIVLPGAFRWDDVTLNVQHDRSKLIARTGAGLTLTAANTGILMRADLPPTRIATDALEAVRAGLLRGASVEMAVQEDRWTDGGDMPLRTISRAVLHGAALVDKPAYSDAEIVARAFMSSANGAGLLSPPFPQVYWL